MQTAAEKSNRLTLAFAKAVGARQNDKSDNLVVSPYNALTALSMVAAGAAGDTREEMAQSLFGVTGRELDGAITALAALNDEVLAANRGQVTLTTANGVWTNDSIVRLNPAYAAALQKVFGAEIAGRDFSSSATLDEINKWAADNTNNLITKVLEQLNRDDALVLASALYFKGDWTRKFDKALTEDRPFTADGAAPCLTPTMQQVFHQEGGVTWQKGADYEAVALTYGEENWSKRKFPSMRLVLVRPSDDGVSARDWLAAQQQDPQWLKQGAFEEAVGKVELPHLDIRQTHDLIPALQDMGIRDAFNPDAANLSGMSADPLAVSKVSHDVVFKTDETGSEAAAVTTVGVMRCTSIPMPPARIDVKLNRSFVMALQDARTGAVLFAGAVNKPNGSKPNGSPMAG